MSFHKSSRPCHHHSGPKRGSLTLVTLSPRQVLLALLLDKVQPLRALDQDARSQQQRCSRQAAIWAGAKG